MKREILSEAMGLLPDEMIERAGRERVRKKRGRWPKILAAAACLCLLAAGAWDTLGRLDYNFFAAGCGAYPGEFAGGVYYYFVPHKGVMRYTPGVESQLALHTYWFEEWQVNGYGIYYWQGMSVYVKDHETGTRTRLYTASRSDCTHIRFTLTGDGNVILTAYNKDTEVVYELLLDGVTGEVLETVMEPTSYDEAKYVYYSRINFIVGDRHIELVPVDEHKDHCLLTEDGLNLLPEGMLVSPSSDPDYFGGALWLSVRSEEGYDPAETARYAVLHPDGRTEIVTVPNQYYYGGTTEYLFYPEENSEVWCTEVATGETWRLEMDAPGDLHDLAANGTHVYTTAPWAEEQVCWRLEYDGAGRPVGLSLISADIAAETGG